MPRMLAFVRAPRDDDFAPDIGSAFDLRGD
jgi:hypothetical protein